MVLAEAEADGGLSRLSCELMGLGLRLASALDGPLEAIILGNGIKGAAQDLLSLGAHTVFVADHPSLEEYEPDVYQAALLDRLEGAAHLTLLAGHTRVGQDLLPRLAARLRAGLVTDCTGVEVDGSGGLFFTKPVFGGNVISRQSVNTPVRMATVRARVGNAPELKAGDLGELVAVDPPPCEPRVRVMGTEKESGEVKLDAARVVVSGGRGMGGGDGFRSLEELAVLLGGAVGASRPPCDSGWIPSGNQVGITGKIVAPDLYIAVAISGSSQHLSGMAESEKIVAINQDPDAYIFKASDYGVAGDWKQVLPSFIGRLQSYTRE